MSDTSRDFPKIGRKTKILQHPPKCPMGRRIRADECRSRKMTVNE
jgi:hypothetical protein